MAPAELLARFDGCPVLVVGDLILDEYVWGTVTRISPEAPVPVVEVRRRSFAAGGAANAAANVAGLGGRVALVGVVGTDPAGEQLSGCVRGGRVAAAALVPDPSRPTTTKTRGIAHAQQVVRFDHEETGPVPAGVRDTLLARARELLPSARACVLSDYGKGVGNDSFPTHLAGAVGVPTLALMGPTRPTVFAHAPAVECLASATIDCTGCHFGPTFRAACDQGCQSLFRLYPDAVLRRVLAILGRSPVPDVAAGGPVSG
jgi:hypothetical protein